MVHPITHFVSKVKSKRQLYRYAKNCTIAITLQGVLHECNFQTKSLAKYLVVAIFGNNSLITVVWLMHFWANFGQKIAVIMEQVK